MNFNQLSQTIQVEKMMNKRMEQLATREEGHSTGGLVEKKRQAAGGMNMY